jgi:hypothetical protein
MNRTRLSALAILAAGLLVFPWVRAVTVAGGAASAGTTMTPSPATPTPTAPVRAALPTIKGWAGESWLNLPRLPDVRYAVVPLSALGVQVSPDSTVRNVRAVALDDHGGVMLTFEPPMMYFPENPVPMVMNSYWSRLSGNLLYRDMANAGQLAYGSGDFGEGWAYPWLPYSTYNLIFPWWGPYAWLGEQSPLPALRQLSQGRHHATSLWAGTSQYTGSYWDSTDVGPGLQAAVITPSGILHLPLSGGRTAGSVEHQTNTESAPLWTNGPRHDGSTWSYTSVWAEAVGVNRLGDAIVREREYDRQSTSSKTIVVLGSASSSNPWYSFTENSIGYDLHRVAGRIYHALSPGGTNLLGRVERRVDWVSDDDWPNNISTSSWTPAASGETVDPRYLNDLRMVAGYRVKGFATGDTPIVPDAGVYDQFQKWFSLPPLAGRGNIGPEGPTPSQRLVLAGLTSGYVEGGAQLAPPVVYGWENFGTTAQPDVRAWWAYAVTTTTSGPGGATTVSVSWVKDRLAVADPLPSQPLRPRFGPWLSHYPGYDYEEPPVWRVNDRLEMVLGDHRVVRNGQVLNLTALATEGWVVWAARDINSHGVILADVASPGTWTSAPALLLPVEWIAPAGDPVHAPVEGGDGLTVPGGGPVPAGANEFTYSASGSGSFTVVLQARVTGLAGLPAAVQDQFVFEVDAIGGSTRVWASGTPNGQPIINGDVITAAVSFHGLPESNNAFGTKRATLRFNGKLVSRQTFEVFWPNWSPALVDTTLDSQGEQTNPQGVVSNHPGVGSGTVPNWFYYWSQACPVPDTTPVWRDDKFVRWDAANQAFGRYWLRSPDSTNPSNDPEFPNTWTGPPYSGPVNRIYYSSVLARGTIFPDSTGKNRPWVWVNRAVHPDTSSLAGTVVTKPDGTPIAPFTTGIDAFHTLMLHEARHVKQTRQSDTLPFWKAGGLARDNVAHSGWSTGASPGDPLYNHFDAVDGIKNNGNDFNLDPDLTELGRDTRPGGLDLSGGFRNSLLPGGALDLDNLAVEKQAREVEVLDDHTKAALDWGNPGKNHQSIKHDD